MSFDLNDAEQMKRVLIDPIVGGVNESLRSIVSRVEALEAEDRAVDVRVRKLEGVASKVLTIYSGAIAVLTYAAHYVWAKVQKKI